MLPFLFLAALLAGCTDPAPAGDPPAAEPARHTAEWTLQRGGSRELNVAMDAGAVVRYRLNASVDVVWDLHSHSESGQVTTHDEGTGRVAEGTFTAPVADTYSLFVRTTGATTLVRLELEGEFTVVS